MSATRDAAAIAADRHQLAEYLALYGPIPGPAVRDAMGWAPTRFWDAVHGSAEEWFLLTARGWVVKPPGGKTERATRPAAGVREPPRKVRAGRSRTAAPLAPHPITAV